MYELIILLLLMRFPMHGYLIAHIINDMIGPYARISNGRLYPLLAKLEKDRLIEADDEGEQARGERNSRRYRITEEGRWRFHTLMMDTTSNPGEYQRIFTHKVAAFSFLKPAERLYLIDHYINYCQAHVLHLAVESEDMQEKNYQEYRHDSPALQAVLEVMKHIQDQWQLELAWAKRLRAEEVSRQEVAAGAQQEKYLEQNQHRKRNSNRSRNEK